MPARVTPHPNRPLPYHGSPSRMQATAHEPGTAANRVNQLPSRCAQTCTVRHQRLPIEYPAADDERRHRIRREQRRHGRVVLGGQGSGEPGVAKHRPVASSRRSCLAPAWQILDGTDGGRLGVEHALSAARLARVDAIYAIEHVIPRNTNVSSCVTWDPPSLRRRWTRERRARREAASRQIAPMPAPEELGGLGWLGA